MKSNRKTKPIILIILVIFFAFSPIFINRLRFNARDRDITSNSNDEFDHDNLKISALSGKIHIDNNWTDTKDVGRCTGNGTYSEPYIIEDLVIDGGGSGSGILIENSNVYFRIENCTVYNTGGFSRFDYTYAGIKLKSVRNGLLFNNNCSNNKHGISLEFSDNNTVSGNIAYNNDFIGIYLAGSNNNTILGNTANNNTYEGIEIRWSSNNNEVSGNTANNNENGIALDWSDYNIVSENTANNNGYEAISLGGGQNNTFSGNKINNNTLGIVLLWSDYNTISGNTVNYNSYGIYLDSSDYNIISGNTLLENHKCIFEENCEGNIFENNDCGGGNGIPIELIIVISIISGGVVIGVATLLLIGRKKNRIE